MGLDIEDIGVKLRRIWPAVTDDQVRAEVRAWGTDRPRVYRRMIHSTSGTPIRPSDRAVADMLARRSAPPRDLTGALMGDPPRGYSALDRRGGA